MGLTVLFVEKDVTIADLLVPSLERKGYVVQVARTKRQAMARIGTRRPDILIIDVVSLGSSGYSVSDAVRSRLDGVPTILLLEQGHASAGRTSDAYMTPQFTSRKLLYRIKKLAEALSSREIRTGDLALDPDSNTLRKGKVTSHLRPKESALLALFMRNPGRVLSRLEIMKKVWETDYMGDTRTLSVHVRWLRLKVEDNPNVPVVLRTVRGVGYRFEVPEKQAK